MGSPTMPISRVAPLMVACCWVFITGHGGLRSVRGGGALHPSGGGPEDEFCLDLERDVDFSPFQTRDQDLGGATTNHLPGNAHRGEGHGKVAHDLDIIVAD